MKSDEISQLRQAIRDAKSPDPQERSRRSRCIRIYLTPEEEAHILARSQGIAASIYCRRKVLGESVPRPRQRIPDINRKLYIEVCSLSRHFKQIAKGINQALSQGQDLPLSQEYLSQIQQTQTVLRDYYRELMQLANDYQSRLEADLKDIEKDNNDADREGHL